MRRKHSKIIVQSNKKLVLITKRSQNSRDVLMCVIISVRDAHVRSTLCIYRPITHNGSTVSNSTRIQQSFFCLFTVIDIYCYLYVQTVQYFRILSKYVPLLLFSAGRVIQSYCTNKTLSFVESTNDPQTASTKYGRRRGNDYNLCIITGDVRCNI